MATNSLNALPFAVSWMLLCAPAGAVTGNDLRAWCGTLEREELTNAEAMAYVHCLAYVQGVVDALIVLEQRSGGQPFCIPDSLTYTEAAGLAREYLERYPARRPLSAAWVIASALEEAFPCSRP